MYMPSSSSASNYSSPPCAACKLLRRKCTPDCIFASYFPPEEPQKFANVHKIFGASNVGKLLNDIPPHQRQDAVNSLAYEAEARARDPVYGCVGAISMLQRQVLLLQKELDEANADIMRYTTASAGGRAHLPPAGVMGVLNQPNAAAQPPAFDHRRDRGSHAGGVQDVNNNRQTYGMPSFPAVDHSLSSFDHSEVVDDDI
ncbi:unnamed protein product [Cuscuta campestris]|uniref:LOB domain-containing protein n=1 Tax=Cuscuta campestris TaxID=132261 RepID=A0A484MSS3_9ASTE|nr:unnamed protein product [Cuscuta campestris]